MWDGYDIEVLLVLLMPEHSKIAQELSFGPIVREVFAGNNKRRVVSATVFLIIAFLIHIKNKKEAFEGF